MTSLRSSYVVELQRRSSGRLSGVTADGLSAAAARVLGVSAAGLVLHGVVALPVGASEPDAVVAEQVEATLTTGPWVDALVTGGAVSAGEAELVGRWPGYHRALSTRTRYRSTAVLPLEDVNRTASGALHLYDTRPTCPLPVDLGTVQEQLGTLLAMLLTTLPEEGLPPYLAHPGHAGRKQVWVAVGMVREALGLGDLDALAVLRAHAFAHDLLLDEVAGRMLDGSLDLGAVLDAVEQD